MSEADIEEFMNMRWDAGSFMVMKNSVFTSQAKSIKSSSMGDWKSCNGPVSIHPWTPLARKMAKFEHMQKLLSPRSGSFAAETHGGLWQARNL